MPPPRTRSGGAHAAAQRTAHSACAGGVLPSMRGCLLCFLLFTERVIVSVSGNNARKGWTMTKRTQHSAHSKKISTGFFDAVMSDTRPACPEVAPLGACYARRTFYAWPRSVRTFDLTTGRYSSRLAWRRDCPAHLGTRLHGASFDIDHKHSERRPGDALITFAVTMAGGAWAALIGAALALAAGC